MFSQTRIWISRMFPTHSWNTVPCDLQTGDEIHSSISGWSFFSGEHFARLGWSLIHISKAAGSDSLSKKSSESSINFWHFVYQMVKVKTYFKGIYIKNLHLYRPSISILVPTESTKTDRCIQFLPRLKGMVGHQRWWHATNTKDWRPWAMDRRKAGNVCEESEPSSKTSVCFGYVNTPKFNIAPS